MQLLPFAAEESVQQLERNIGALTDRSPTTLVRDGVDARGMVSLLLEGLEPQFAPVQPIPGLAESCTCSEERLLRTLKILPQDELREIMCAKEQIEAKCEFCGTEYTMSHEEVRGRDSNLNLETLPSLKKDTPPPLLDNKPPPPPPPPPRKSPPPPLF